jgi:hypothetical protein
VNIGSLGYLPANTEPSDQNHQPAARVPVLLVPDAGRRLRSDLYKSAYTDELGRFHLQGIAPSEYGVFAWEDIEQDVWRDPEFIRRSENSGRLIHIAEGASENIELTVIPFAYR